jgi:Protein of unknown function (DUF2800)
VAGLHAVLSASGAGRWARCVGSPFFTRGVKDAPTIYAASGTCTHWLSERYLRDGVAPETYLGQELEFDGFKFKVEQDRCDRVHRYVNAIRQEPGTLLIEQRLDTSRVLDVPGQYGRTDAITAAQDLAIVRKEDDGEDHHYTGIVSVHDLKDGHEPVYAKDNFQGLIYCSSALDLLDLEGSYDGVRFCIHQPIIDHYDEWFYSRAEIIAFVAAIRPLARLAWDLYNGTIPFDPTAHLNPGEKQCQYCPKRADCKRRTEHVVAMFKPQMKAANITNEELGAIRLTLDEIKRWVKDMETEADRRVLAGSHVDGLKAVRGNRGNRRWVDPKTAEAKLVEVLHGMAYGPREIVSPTEAERLAKLADVDIATLAPLWDRSDAPIIVVPEGDKRQSVAVSRPEFNPVDTLAGIL